MTPEQYNVAREGSLWFREELPDRLAQHPTESKDFSLAVRWFQRSLGLNPDGKLGPRTWAAVPKVQDYEEQDRQALLRPNAPMLDRRIDSEDEARRAVNNSLTLSPHVREEVDAWVSALRGTLTEAQARSLYRAMRADGRTLVAELLRQGGQDAATAYAYKGRTAEEMRRSYAKRWHKYLTERRQGMGTHWTGGTGSAVKAAKYLLTTKPGRVSTNVFIDYDGSTVICYPTVVDPDILDDTVLFTAHGAHNPACFGVDFCSPGFLRRKGSQWTTQGGSRVKDSVVAACGVVHLPDIKDRTWAGRHASVPWANRSSQGRVWSIQHFLAPTWLQMASYIVLGRVHAKLLGWTEQDIVVCGHHQRSDSRADPFYYPLRWAREAILSDADMLDASTSWLVLVNPEDAGGLLQSYRAAVRGTAW